MWVIMEKGRPKYLYSSKQEALVGIDGLTGISLDHVKHYDDIWFVRVGDQFVFSSETARDAQPFLQGMLVMSLMSHPDG